jgi:methionine sulfoxide reductase catalytic subunit
MASHQSAAARARLVLHFDKSQLTFSDLSETMQYIIRKPWHLPQREHTPESIYRNRKLHRREFLGRLGLGIAAAGMSGFIGGCNSGTDEEILQAGRYDPIPTAAARTDDAVSVGTTDSNTGKYPAKRNPQFEYGRDETREVEAARYTNFYEFTMSKSVWQHVGPFKPSPWKVQIDGLCSKPITLDFDDILRRMTLEERHYRHRCVETWAMCVPWTGFRLRDLLEIAEPKPAARFVQFRTFDRPDEAPNRSSFPEYPWPYTEGLTIGEAANELAFIATGMYGHPLLKQHGAPLRLVVPWKYGFKCIKSIVQITFTAEQPATFWNTLQPQEYAFEANVEPDVPHPRWSQRRERMLGSDEIFDTVVYNGYGEYVAGLYRT